MCQCMFDHIVVPDNARAIIIFVPRAIGPDALDKMRQTGEAWRKANPRVPSVLILPDDCQAQLVVADDNGQFTTLTPTPIQRTLTQEEAAQLFAEGIRLSMEAGEQDVPTPEPVVSEGRPELHEAGDSGGPHNPAQG